LGSKINVKARISRHSRILKEDFSSGSNFSHKKTYHGYNIVLIAIVFLVPIYPAFSSFIHNNTAAEFYRGDVDEDSIISSFYKSWDSVWESDFVVESKDSFLSINTTLEWARNSFGTDIIEYTVKEGESVALVSEKFKVSKNTIYWANDLDTSATVHPGDVLKVPPVSGMIHEVQSGDTISSIAQKYDIAVDKILAQNLMTSSDTLSKWKNLIVPGAVKPKPKPVYVAPTYARSWSSSSSSSGGYSFAAAAKSEYVNTTWRYKLTPKPSYHTFYWWNCTWYVAKYKTVNWWGNANQWLRNAQAKWHPTGNTPTLGSIVVLNWRGYNPRYGHVAIVMDIKSDHLIVSDMNYRRLGEVTTRKIPKNDRAIMWYIYVE